MSKTILPSLCLTIIIGLSFSTSAWSQSFIEPRPLPPAAIALQQKIESKEANAEVLKQQLQQTQKNKQATAKNLESLDTWEKEVGISIESFPEIIKSLQSQRIDLIVDLAGLTAKRDAILSAQKEVDDESKAATDHKIILSEALLETSLELAEKKARLTSVKTLLADVLPARKELESASALKIKSQKALEQEIEISNKVRQSTTEVNMLRKKLDELKKANSDFRYKFPGATGTSSTRN